MCYSFSVEFNTARPGRRKLTISPSGSGLYPFQDKATTIYPIANAGAMLFSGQKRSKEKTALAAEPGCASDSKRALNEFQAHTTTPKGWPVLFKDLHFWLAAQSSPWRLCYGCPQRKLHALRRVTRE